MFVGRQHASVQTLSQQRYRRIPHRRLVDQLQVVAESDVDCQSRPNAPCVFHKTGNTGEVRMSYNAVLSESRKRLRIVISRQGLRVSTQATAKAFQAAEVVTTRKILPSKEPDTINEDVRPQFQSVRTLVVMHRVRPLELANRVLLRAAPFAAN